MLGIKNSITKIIRIPFVPAVFCLFVVVGGFTWLTIKHSVQSQKLASLHNTLGEKNVQIVTLQQKKHRAQRYQRIYKALVFLSYGRMTPEALHEVSESLFALSKQLQFDPLLVLALVSTESQGDPDAMGKYRDGTLSGAYGLMQVKPGTAQLMAKEIGYVFSGEQELFDPAINLYLGTHYLVKLILKYKSLRLGIMAYNIGPGALKDRLANQIPLPRRYYNRILSNYRALVQRFGSNI